MALEGYLGEAGEGKEWRLYDVVHLLEDGYRYPGKILLDQGADDQYLDSQLKVDLLQAACQRMGQDSDIRLRPGYDHSTFFLRTFLEEHFQFHAEQLSKTA